MDLFSSLSKLFPSHMSAPDTGQKVREAEQAAIQHIDKLGYEPSSRYELMHDEMLSAISSVFISCVKDMGLPAPLLRFPGEVRIKLEITSTTADRFSTALQNRAEIAELTWYDVAMCHRPGSSHAVELWEIGNPSGDLRNFLTICQFEDGAELMDTSEGGFLKLLTGPSSADFPGLSYPWTLTYRTVTDGPLRVLTIDNKEGEILAYARKDSSAF